MFIFKYLSTLWELQSKSCFLPILLFTFKFIPVEVSSLLQQQMRETVWKMATIALAMRPRGIDSWMFCWSIYSIVPTLSLLNFFMYKKQMLSSIFFSVTLTPACNPTSMSYLPCDGAAQLPTPANAVLTRNCLAGPCGISDPG